ncbi:MAG: endolytic transglycosylase MltG [Pseudomonadota bacterium]
MAQPADASPDSQPPKRKRRGLRFAVITLCSLLLLAAIAVAGGYVWALALYQRAGPLTAETTVVVPRGTGLNAIAERLAEAGVIETPEIFILAAKLEGQAAALKAGEYAFQPQISMQATLAKLVAGDIVQRRLTLPEGLTSWDMVQRINAAPDLEGPVISEIPAEGTLLPDTYFFERGETRAGLIARMKQAHDEALAELWPTRDEDLPFDSKEDWVTLASIIEKETGLDGERGLVAGVFVNRLNRGMRLQSDPTVIYAVTKGEGGPLGRGIRKSELANPDPYNTYTNDGLPPGPIANPGRAALEAAIRPAETDYIFFVADGTGGHGFSKTLAEHNRKVREWRRIERERKAAE